MQLAKMVVLGSLEILENASGYDVYQYLERNQIDRWTEIQKPSIYNALKQLEKESAIELMDTIKNGNYPEKTTYQITEKGKQLFDSLQEEAFLGIYPRFFGFKIALKFNKRRSVGEIKNFADRAVSVIDNILRAMDEHLESLPENSEEQKRDKFFIEHDRRLFITERQWIIESLEFINDNTIAENVN